MKQDEINIPDTCDVCPHYIDGACRYDELFGEGCYYAVIEIND